MMLVRLSALCTSYLRLPGDIPGTYFCYRLSKPQGHSVASKNKSMKNPNDPVGN